MASRSFLIDSELVTVTTTSGPYLANRRAVFNYFNDETILFELEYAVPVVMARFCADFSVSASVELLEAKVRFCAIRHPLAGPRRMVLISYSSAVPAIALGCIVHCQLRCQLLKCIVASNSFNFFEVCAFSLFNFATFRYHFDLASLPRIKGRGHTPSADEAGSLAIPSSHQVRTFLCS